ncbi:MAG: glycosyltransferase family 4 protein [Bryobacteraceae bacterium]
MKVFQVLSGGAWGGGAVVVLAITRALINRGDEVWVLCLDEGVASRFRAAGATVVTSPLWFHPINPLDVAPFAQLYALCVRERFDLVATHTSKGGFLGRLAARLAGTPHIVHHAHGFAFRECNSWAVRRFYIALERLASGYCDSIISVSEDHRQGAIREGVASADQIKTVLNGIDLLPFRETNRTAMRRAFGFREDDVVLCVGSRLAPKKGLEYLMAAMPAVIARHPSVHLVLFGEGPLQVELLRQAEQLGISRHIHFPGFRKDIPQLLGGFDVVLQPSLSEGLSISILEAMAAGRPIIACDIQGNREVIRHGKNGLLVPPANAAALAEAIVRILSDPALAKTMGEEAARDCRTRFSQDRMVDETLAVYDRVCRSEVSEAIEPEELIRL